MSQPTESLGTDELWLLGTAVVLVAGAFMGLQFRLRRRIALERPAAVALVIVILATAGPHVKGVDTSMLSNKVMCGYQGWFNAEGDGAERGWVHWTKGRGPPGPGNAKIGLSLTKDCRAISTCA